MFRSSSIPDEVTTSISAPNPFAISGDDRKRAKLSHMRPGSQTPHPLDVRSTSAYRGRPRGVVVAAKKYRGHIDGVWDVAATSFPVNVVDNDEYDCVRKDAHGGTVRLVATASAGSKTYPNVLL